MECAIAVAQTADIFKAEDAGRDRDAEMSLRDGLALEIIQVRPADPGGYHE
jgi:hypothetical protein